MFDEKSVVWIARILASLLCACFYFVATIKSVGALQQSGYNNKKFWKWLRQERNTYFSRLLFWTVLSVSSTALFIFVFFFLGEDVAMVMGGIPFLGFAVLFYFVDRKFALKVKTVKSKRWMRLSIFYCISIAVTAFVLIFLCSLLEGLLGMFAFGWICALRFLPLCFVPLILPSVLTLTNAIVAPLERKNNQKFIKTAGQVLNESKIIKIGIVGSYGKTSVKNILNTLLSSRFKVVATPASYNTPMGVAKTVGLEEFSDAEIMICEMGAKKVGDIKELCDMVQPDYMVFTGVCAQHVETFGDEETVFHAKCEALFSSAKLIVCGNDLKQRILEKYPIESGKCRFVGNVEKLVLRADGSSFELPLSEGLTAVDTCLLGEAAAENILLAATVAEELGLSASEIAERIALIEPVPHRLELMENNGVYILDDAYNCNVKGAKIAIDALKRFSGKKIIITPGIVETGVLQAEINGALGEELAKANLDKIVLVGETQAKVIIEGFVKAGGDMDVMKVSPSLEHAVELIKRELVPGDCILFMNDLPDVI